MKAPHDLLVFAVLLLGALFSLTAQTRAQSGVPLWINQYDGRASGDDFPHALVVDHDGNVFVTGQSGSVTNTGYATIKYSGLGVALWTNRYDLLGNVIASATAIAVDLSGNVFVTGTLLGTSALGTYHCVTIAYSGAGVPLWTNLYAQSTSSDDHPAGIAVDQNGNVFVTGYSSGGSGLPYHFVTIAYSNAGVPLWTNRYYGSAASNDYATALAVDMSGNVFVTGRSIGAVGSYEYATVAYAGSGASLWTNRYSGSNGSDCEPAGIALDSSGNVFVTGTAFGYATIAYSGTGLPLWTNVFAGSLVAAAIATDNGNVFVTGNALISGQTDYATVAYSSTGALLWTNWYDAAGWNDYPAAIAVDGNGNVFVTGTSTEGNGYWDYTTIAYSSSGIQLWSMTYDGTVGQNDSAAALGVDSAGNVFVTGRSDEGGTGVDYVTVAYSNSGVPLWTATYDGRVKSDDSVDAMAVDSGGNVIVAGSCGNYSDQYEQNYISSYVTIKYAADGTPLWTNIYAGFEPQNVVKGIAVDSDGNVFVTGTSIANFGYYPEIATVAYSSTGVPMWTNRFTGLTVVGARAAAVAVDNTGNVFITGSAWNGADRDYATVKYSGLGGELWERYYDGSPGGNDYPSAIAVDSNGNVFVTGQSIAPDSSFAEFTTVGYSSQGDLLWANSYRAANADHDARAIAVDGSGNVIVAGYSYRTGTSRDYATIKYTNTGVALWTNRYTGPGNYDDYADALAVDNAGNVLVAGQSSNGNSDDYAFVKYSASGTLQWTRRYNGPGRSEDFATGVAVDSNGNVFVTGSSVGTSGFYEFATLAYSGAGIALWTNRFKGSPNGNSGANAIATDMSGNVIVGGYLWNGTDLDFGVIKYAALPPPPAYLNLQRLNDQIVLTWTNVGFGLQSAPAPIGTFTNIPNASSPYPTTITGLQQYFRLRSN